MLRRRTVKPFSGSARNTIPTRRTTWRRSSGRVFGLRRVPQGKPSRRDQVTIPAKAFVSLTTLALLSVRGARLLAADPPQQAPPPTSAAALPTTIEPPDAEKLSLGDCLQRALENNLQLAIVKKDPDIAAENVTFQKAAFDPVLGARLTHAETTQETIITNFVGQPTEKENLNTSTSKTDTLDGFLN